MKASRFGEFSLRLALCGLAISVVGACCSTEEYENLGYRRSEFVQPVFTPVMLAQLISGNTTPGAAPKSLVQGISLLQSRELQFNPAKAARDPLFSLRLKRSSVIAVMKYEF